MSGNHYCDSELKLTVKGLQNGSRLVPENSILLLVRGGALHSRIPVGIATRCLAFNQDVKALKVKEDCIRPWYLLYWIMGNERYLLESVVEYTGIGAGKLDTKRMQALQIQLPTLAEQDEIVSFVKSIDDRITLQRETNATLEAIAQALFKSWFVDFDPVRAKMEGHAHEDLNQTTAELFPDALSMSELGMIPHGWQVRTIGDLVEMVGGATPSTKDEAYWAPATYHWTSPKDLSGLVSPVLLDTERKISAAGLEKISSGLLPVGTLLMSSRAPIGYLAVAQMPVAINQGYIAMLPESTLPPLFMLFWCKHNMQSIKGHANGSTFMEISKKVFRSIPIVEPPKAIVEAFVDVVGDLFARLAENERQARTLVTLRDTLLPRLVSGQLRLPQTESETE